MARTRVGINGFGRIGKQVFRALRERYGQSLEVVAINSLADPATSAHMLKYDSTYGRFKQTVSVDRHELVVGGDRVSLTSEADPSKLSWRDLGVKLVVETSGVFNKASQAAAHIESGASKVLISAPSKDADITIVYGINHTDFDSAKHRIISAASCTTICVVPMVKILNDTFGIENAMFTTIHSYTADQRLVDKRHKDLRRARAGAISTIPTTTGAARTVEQIIPELKGKLEGLAFRVPTITVSVVDLTAKLTRPVTVEDINSAYRRASTGSLKGVLAYSTEPLVSADYIGDPHACTLDALSTATLGGDFIKVVGWYDNEWGYSCQVASLANHIGGSC